MDLREYLSEEVQAVHKNTTYDLIANIVHDGKPSEGSYRIHVLHHVSGSMARLGLQNRWCSCGGVVFVRLFPGLASELCAYRRQRL